MPSPHCRRLVRAGPRALHRLWPAANKPRSQTLHTCEFHYLAVTTGASWPSTALASATRTSLGQNLGNTSSSHRACRRHSGSCTQPRPHPAQPTPETEAALTQRPLAFKTSTAARPTHGSPGQALHRITSAHSHPLAAHGAPFGSAATKGHRVPRCRLFLDSCFSGVSRQKLCLSKPPAQAADTPHLHTTLHEPLQTAGAAEGGLPLNAVASLVIPRTLWMPRDNNQKEKPCKSSCPPGHSCCANTLSGIRAILGQDAQLSPRANRRMRRFAFEQTVACDGLLSCRRDHICYKYVSTWTIGHSCFGGFDRLTKADSAATGQRYKHARWSHALPTKDKESHDEGL